MQNLSTRKLFVKYAIPQMVGLLFNSVYFIVDGVFIGNRLGRDALAAAAVSVPLIEIFIALSLAIASGAGVLVASFLARGENHRAVQVFNQATLFTLALSLLIALLGNLLLDPLARMLGSVDSIHQEARTYLWFIITSAPFSFLSFLLGGMARNDGRPRLAMIAMAVGAVSNIILDYLFMYPLNLGIMGAALATALGPVFSVVILLQHFIRKKGSLMFEKTRLRIKTLGQIARLGFPAFIMEFSIGIITLVYNLAIVLKGYGEIGLAAYLVIGYLMLMILTVFLGLAEGLQPVFSAFSSLGMQDKIHSLRQFSLKVFLVLGGLSLAFVLFMSEGFFTLFSPNDPELVAFSVARSLPYFIGFTFSGINILYIVYWQSLHQVGKALWVSLARSLLLPPLLVVALPLFFGREGIWFALSVAEMLTAGLVVALYCQNEKRTPELAHV